MYKNYNLEDKLKKITTTFQYGQQINTDCLYFFYENAYNKSSKRIENIIYCINNNKNNITKKYQIKGIHEYKFLEQYCIENNIKHELIFDKTVLTNKVKNIVQYINDYDYENNLEKIYVANKKIPTMYIQIYHQKI